MTNEQTDKSTRHTDIRLMGWWQKLPRVLHPYLFLARFDRPIGWWLPLLLRLVDHSASRREQPTDGTDDGAVFAWRNDNAGAGCVVNDMCGSAST